MIQPTEETPRKASRILIVEDDMDVRETLEEILIEEGYPVTTCAGGREALSYLETAASPPGLILLDLMMPQMDGWQFRAQQRQRVDLPVVPTVILSADGNVEHNMQTLQADDYLRKPIQIKALLKLVARFCGPPL